MITYFTSNSNTFGNILRKIMRSVVKLSLLFCLTAMVACVPESKKVKTTVETDVLDETFIRIQDHQNAGNLDSLLSYMSHEDPTYRYLAARAFASYQDPRSLDSLYQMLDDPILKVRSVAAYAIGQIGNPESESALVNGFRQRDTMSVDNASNAAILEAIGKVGSKEMPSFMINASGYRDTDTLLMLGRAKSLYYFALRGIHTPEMTEHAVQTLRNYRFDDQIRLYAAHYLARSKKLDIEKVKFQIAEAFVDEKNAFIKMALANALRHTKDKEIHQILLTQLELVQDYRIKVNIIRTLKSYDYIDSAQKILDLLKSNNIHVALAASEFLAVNGVKEDAGLYRSIARDSLPWQVKTSLYGSIMKLLPFYYSKTKNATRWQIQQAIEKDSNDYVLAGYLHALGNDPESYPLITEILEENDNVIIQTAGLEALGSIVSHSDFNAIFKSTSTYHRQKILDIIKTSLASGDEGKIATAANIIANDKSLLKPLIDSTEFLLEAKASLNMPEHVESIHAIEKALAHLRGVNQPNLSSIDNYKKVNWSLLNEYSEETKAIIKTNKGAFTIDLYLSDAPASVLNFIALANENFYDGKVFHRVVPNFVIQTGSPRGDSYGGKDYAIRSEVGPLYYNDEGFVGMASAGLHTESTQWFVTHSPTPHLDGKYTIFGKITEGMDIVHQIQQGDTILDVIISNL